MRRDRRGGGHRRRPRALVRRVVAGRPPRALRRRRPRGRVAAPPRARRAGRARGARRRPAQPLGRRRARRRHAGPGLVGALLVGLSAAKAIAWARGLPLVPVDHLEGHVASLYLEPDPLEPPFTCLLASGGHTLLLAVRERGRSERLGTTLDDAAGEAFDKGARLLGSAIRAARRSTGSRRRRPERVRLPRRARPGPRLLLLRAEDRAALHGARPRAGGDGAPQGRSRGLVPARDRAGARAAARARRRRRPGSHGIAVVGGVAANSELRAALPDARFAPLELCTDNAAMIASARASSRRFRTLATLPRCLCVSLVAPRSWLERLRRSRSSSASSGARAQQAPSTPIDEAGWQGVLGVRARRLDRAALRRPPEAAVARRARARGRRGGDREGDARVDGRRRRAAGAVPRAALGSRRADRAGVPVHARRQRVLGPARPDVARAARARPRGRPASIRFASRIRRRPPRTEASCPPPSPTSRSPGSTAPASPSRSSTPASTRRIRTCADAFSPASTSSTREAAGSRSRIRRSPGGPSATRRSSRGSSPGPKGPDGLHGIAPGASILPVRVGGWQPNSEGGYSVYSRTDQILAGLEAAVDPNDDGDAHDAARIALIGMVEPYAAFADGPLAARHRRRGRSRHAHDRPRRERRQRRARRTGASPGPAAAESALTVARRRRTARALRRFACSCAPVSACSTRTTCRSAARRRTR